MNKKQFNELHKFLEDNYSPDTEIKLIEDAEENSRVIFDGYAGEITESIMFKNWEVTFYCLNKQRTTEILIWIKYVHKHFQYLLH